MQSEREELVRRIFPQLKNFCEQRGVILREVDLRWGIPQNEIDEGNLLPTCLAEVTNCHPFFVCFLGNRYGTIIEKIPEEILQDKPWLREYQSRSITELEVLLGVFINPNPLTHAFFYFRHSDYLMHADQVNFQDIDAESINKLESLKDRIRQSRFKPRDYKSPQHLGELLFTDLTDLFEKLFPIKNVTDSFERENIEQNALVEALSYNYSGLQKYFDALDKFAGSQHSLAIITGDAGSGKSALLANWARKYEGHPVRIQPSKSLLNKIYKRILRFLKPSGTESVPESLLITHFVGSTEQSSDWGMMLRRILMILGNHFQLPLEIPEARHLLPTFFSSFLESIPKSEKVILIIDGINKINIDNSYSSFSWLPLEFPSNVKLILSATSRADLGDLKQRKHISVEMQPLLVNERETFITDYLEQYRKSLDRQMLRKIASSNNTTNPLYLRTFLEELRLVAKHSEELNSLSDYYLTAQDTQKIFEKLIIRLEKDFNLTTPGTNNLVRNTLCLLWASHSGLSENELTELLGTPHNPLPAAIWSPFYLSIKNHLINRIGLLVFFHDSFRQAVETVYLKSDGERLKTHRQIAEYLKKQGSLPRQISELPWHLATLNDWAELSTLLSQQEFLTIAWKTHKYEVQYYWSLIQENSPYRIINAYQPVLDSPSEYKKVLWAVCFLLNENGHISEVLKLLNFLETEARTKNDDVELQASFSMKAEILKKLGDFDHALIVLRETQVICQRNNNQPALAASFGNQAVIMYEKGDFETALKLHAQEENIYRHIPDLAGLSTSLGNQALNWEKRKDFTKSMELFREQERICMQLGDISGLQKNSNNQGLVLWKLGKDNEAIKMLKTSEDICRKLNYLFELQTCLGNQALIFESIGDYDETDELLTEREEICRKIPAPAELGRTLWQRSRLYIFKLNVPDFAAPLIKEAIQLAEQHRDTKLLQEIRMADPNDFRNRN